MTKFRLPPGAASQKLPDGTVYRARGAGRNGGTIDVDNPRHAKQIAQASQIEGGWVHSLHTAPIVAGRECTSCGFAAWKWQTECPRCGAPTLEVR